jgi:hypothetical protein
MATIESLSKRIDELETSLSELFEQQKRTNQISEALIRIYAEEFSSLKGETQSDVLARLNHRISAMPGLPFGV